MFKHEIKYMNYLTEKEETKKFYFNLNKQESMEFSIKYPEKVAHVTQLGERAKKLDTMDDAERLALGVELYNLAIFFIDISYCVVTEEGFLQKDEASLNKFKQCDAYSELAYSMVENPTLLTELIMGIMPDTVKAKMQELKNKQN